MRRRKRYSADQGSLELLLDTITNTFGGIVFLAILIVVLLQTTPDKIEAQPTQNSQKHTIDSRKLESLKAQIEELELQLRFLDIFAAELSEPDLEATLAELENRTEVREKLTEEKSVILEQLEKSKENMESIAQQQQTLDSELASNMQEVEKLQDQLESERKQRTIKAKFSEERSTSKREYNVTLRYGRWYIDILPSGKPNLEDFIMLDTGGEYLTLTPKPNRGKPLTSGNTLSPEVLQELNNRDPKTEYICIGIWDDSFEEFQLLRDYLVNQGFNYRLIPLTDGDTVFYGPVSDAKVQ